MLIGQGHFVVISMSLFPAYRNLKNELTGWIWFSGDKLVGEVSRLVVAEACIQALDIDFSENQIYEINSVKVISNI